MPVCKCGHLWLLHLLCSVQLHALFLSSHPDTKISQRNEHLPHGVSSLHCNSLLLISWKISLLPSQTVSFTVPLDRLSQGSSTQSTNIWPSCLSLWYQHFWCICRTGHRFRCICIWASILGEPWSRRIWLAGLGIWHGSLCPAWCIHSVWQASTFGAFATVALALGRTLAMLCLGMPSAFEAPTVSGATSQAGATAFGVATQTTGFWWGSEAKHCNSIWGCYPANWSNHPVVVSA
jgi:hypothetical protein